MTKEEQLFYTIADAESKVIALLGEYRERDTDGKESFDTIRVRELITILTTAKTAAHQILAASQKEG